MVVRLVSAAALVLALVASDESLCSESGEYVHVFVENFDEPALNTSLWSLVVGSGNSRVRDAWGTADNVYIENGSLVLRSQRQRYVTPSGDVYNYTSGAVESRDAAYWPSGRACVRAILPGDATPGRADGVWPAHWMMPNDASCWPDHGEIDIMEMINGDGVSHGTFHWDKLYPGTNCTGQKGNDASSGSIQVDKWNSTYHEYAVEWDGSTYVAFFVDGKLIENVTTAGPKRPYMSGAPFYMILNTAIGGPWPRKPTEQTTMPVYHKIDSVVVSRKRSQL